MKYGVIVHKETYNLGDDIQSYAAMKLLPRVDYIIDREHTDTFRSRNGEAVAAIMAGWWFWQKWNWPPSDYIFPMSTSIHFNINDIYDRGCPMVDEWMTGPGGEWLKAQEPIGVRDEESARFLQERGFQTYFSGCITLTLPKQKMTRDKGQYIVLVDLNEKLKKRAKELVEPTGLRVVEISHRQHYSDPNVSWNKRVKYVEKILTLYQNASCVITRRLHVTLPCLAMEVPVLPIVDLDSIRNSVRWYPYQQWTRCVTNQDFLDGNFEFDFKNPPPNRTDYLETREKLIASVQDFIRYAEAQNGKTVQELRRVSYTEEDVLRWQNRLMKEALEKWLHQNRKMATRHKKALQKQTAKVTLKNEKIRALRKKVSRLEKKLNEAQLKTEQETADAAQPTVQPVDPPAAQPEKKGGLWSLFKKRGIAGACLNYGKQLLGVSEPASEEKEELPPKEPARILLLTNRDSDNCGDQVMEACDISLLKTVVKNLDIQDRKVIIESKAPSMIAGWLTKQRKRDLQTAEAAVSRADLVVFGGAPMFNYLYQDLYRKTIEIVNLAEKHNKPVVFSAIGIESYDAKNERCQALKRAINSPCVKQIMTRDHLELLEKYKDREDLKIGRVADPAVLAESVFQKHLEQREDTEEKKIGIFVIRANAFVDNKISFPREAAAEFWVGLARELQARGYAYEFVTSGHFADEAMVDRLVRDYGIPLANCAFNMNTPEKLVRQISGYSAVISCRLHPGIISYALGIPAVGIVWNPKVRGFYHSIGQDARLIEKANLTPEYVADQTVTALEEGIQRDTDYLCGIYRSLFAAVRDSICPEKADVVPYTYEQLQENMVPFDGTSAREVQEKLKRKFRRVYRAYNREFEKTRKNEAKIREMEKQALDSSRAKEGSR